jgi:hypothetical protein
MYDLINYYAGTVVGTIPSDHITEYEWLVQNPSKATQPDYQNRYRRFWAMNAARLSPTFYAAYFGALNATTTQSTTLGSLAQTLHAASTNSKGRQSLQFSFATKLLHITNPYLPIYDSQVAAFYFFQEPDIKDPKNPQDLQRRINAFVTFHDFLKQEYARVLQNNLLATAIQEFRVRFNPQHFTDEKVVDSLIWAFVGLLWKGALRKARIVYH